ncbi:MAG: uracil-DNA glycosylase [Bacillus sp. (in: firmicutes)]
MKIPDELVESCKVRMGDRPVEGFVYGSGPKNPKLMLVGEAPGETEIGNGIPFSGRAGQELMKFLEGLGLAREDVYITSAVRSRPYIFRNKKHRDGTVERRKYNRPPTAAEIKAHAPIIDYEIEHVEAPIIITLGNVGLKRLAGAHFKVTKDHGQFLRMPVRHLVDGTYLPTKEEYLLFPTFHPASIFYNPSLRDLIAEDQRKLRGWLQKQNQLSK